MADLRIGTLHKGDSLSALANNTSESATHMEVRRIFRASVFHLFWFLVCKAFLKFNNKKFNRRATVWTLKANGLCQVVLLHYPLNSTAG